MSGEGAALVWVDPRRMGGQPCIYGHRLTTRQVARMVRDYGIEFVHEGWSYLTDEQIEGAIWFEGVHGRDRTLRRWYRERTARVPSTSEGEGA